jgi:murein L,D-transpeptidase YafK
MKILLLLLFFTVSIFANNTLNNYRINGIEKIEKQMDLELTKQKYWEKHLLNKDTTFGYIESYKNILTCNKDESTLKLYSTDKNSKFNFKKKFDAFTGKRKGDKIQEGDLKTPIGIYKLVKKLSKKTDLNPFYGPLAFVTSYPNIYDSYRGKNGSGIWIHGLPTEQERDEFTRGCIAINNLNIKSLDKDIDISKTLLLINSSKPKQRVSKDTLSLILSKLYSWRYAWLYSELDNYLNFYSLNFVRNDGMSLKKFKKYKARIFKKKQKKTILFDNINIIPYPDSNNVFKITFKELYKSNTYKFIGNKTLILQVSNKKNIKILTER